MTSLNLKQAKTHIRKRLSPRQKLAYLRAYEAQMKQGKERAGILSRLAKRIVVSEREAERILSQAREYRSEVERHQRVLSITALALASNLETCLATLGTAFTAKIGDVVYGGGMCVIDYQLQSVRMQNVDKAIALNLLCHLKHQKAELPELADIDDWSELTPDRITEDLLSTLKIKGYRGDFNGRCPECPR